MTVAGSLAAQPLYDARRGVYYAKPVFRGWLHLLCFGASLVAGRCCWPTGTEPRG